MNYFLNYENNSTTIRTYRAVNAYTTDVQSIISAQDAESAECLTANLDIWAAEELSKIDLSVCADINEAKNAVFGEWDFLELTLKDLNIDICEYPELREYQNDFISEYFD